MVIKSIKKLFLSGATAWIAFLLVVVWVIQPNNIIALAQGNRELDLSLSRDFGYSSGTGKIQGTFTMKITSAIDLQKVVFYIDDTAIGEDSQAPFQFQFSTTNFSLQEHTLYALGYAAEGNEYASNIIRVQFVSAEEGWQAAIKIVIPIIAIVIGAMLISFAIPLVFRRGKSPPTALPQKFGLLGGAICPKCKQPFNIPLLKINLLTGSLLPCPYCRKWSIVRRASPTELQAAWAATQTERNPDKFSDRPDEISKKDIDDSRYMDL
ncbi:MAG: hypothetical protein JW908_08955 [Anaerolineales bacterium]|nr:hypothetical protein [Anaerolineales bacterium]